MWIVPVLYTHLIIVFTVKLIFVQTAGVCVCVCVFVCVCVCVCVCVSVSQHLPVYVCRKAVTGSSLQLDQALKAIFESDLGALGNLLASESLGVDSADEEGNTLLHYAVACQRDDIVKLLCERLVYM